MRKTQLINSVEFYPLDSHKTRNASFKITPLKIDGQELVTFEFNRKVILKLDGSRMWLTLRFVFGCFAT